MSSHWSGVGVGGYVEEEGELVESGGETSDDDYSPGSLVIDAKDEGTIGTIIHQSAIHVCVYMYIQCIYLQCTSMFMWLQGTCMPKLSWNWGD